MLEMSWITAILQLYSPVADLIRNVIVKHINIRLFDLLARFHYILNLPRMFCYGSLLYRHLILHFFIQFLQTLLSYVIFPFFIK